MTHRMTELKPEHYITKEECQEMIDDAIRQHNVTMFIQGHFIFHGKHGYRHAEREQEKMSETRKQIEDLLKDK